MTNKTRLEMGAKVVALFLFGILTIITCVAVWDYCPEPFVKWCAGILMAANAVAGYVVAKKTMFNY